MFANYHLIQDAMRFQSGLKKCWRKAGLSQQIVSLLQLPSNRNMTKVYHAKEGIPGLNEPPLCRPSLPNLLCSASLRHRVQSLKTLVKTTSCNTQAHFDVLSGKGNGAVHEKASRTALQTSSLLHMHTLLKQTHRLQSRKLQNNVVNFD